MQLRKMLTLLVASCSVTFANGAVADELEANTLTVQIDPNDPDNQEIGELTYLGGLELEPGADDIGGISGLEWSDNRLFAIADNGKWLAMTLDELDNRLLDIIAIEGGPLLDLRGKRLRGKQNSDAESLSRGSNGDWLISFEQDHRIWRYPTLDGTPTPNGSAVLELVADAQANGGLEALASTADGLLACGEWTGTSTPNCARTTEGPIDPFALVAPEAVSARMGAPTAADCANDGTCYVLFRSYTPGYGNTAAIIALSQTNEARILATLTPPTTLDNFEGLTVREENGRTFLYLVSDNNFSDNQRTLIMKFMVQTSTPAVASETVPDAVVEQIYETVDVVLETSHGDITIALEIERAPITAGNFLRYVDQHRLDGTVFYRAMDLDWGEPPNGLLQGGTQHDPQRVLEPIAHESTASTGLSHTNGALSMARFDPGSATGDFSIMIRDQTGLDAQPGSDDPNLAAGFAVFGYVIDGMEVVQAIHAQPTDPNKGEGWLKGQLLAEPVEIISARRAEQD
ncbi:MAG: esterase-like activity of phytase family protein [Erythrobacter sp.]